MLQFKKKVNGIDFDISFEDDINVIKGASGTGKTFLFNVISSYCTNNKISYAFIDYKFVASGDESLILSHCMNKDIIILDNADLYLNPELFEQIKGVGATIILSKKSTFGLDMRNAHLYVIDYRGSLLRTRRIC